MKVRDFIPLAEPWIDKEEAEEVYKVVESGWLRQGELVKKFEKEFAKTVGTKYAVAVSSGTAALHVAFAALDLGGSEVIMPSFTCIPPFSMAILAGATPVLVDIELETYNICPEAVRKAISSKTKAIVPINYAGHPAELAELVEIANENGIFLVNDAAEALGATYNNKKIGKFGDIAVFSFSPNKTITTGEGGMIATNNEELAEMARVIRDYGQKQRFHYIELGSNYHMTEMQAAIGLVQLKKLDKIIGKKRKNARLLTEYLGDSRVITPVEKSNCTHVYMLYTVRVEESNRDLVMSTLEKKGIQCRVYFPPVHWSPIVKKYPCVIKETVNTDTAGSQVFSLPSSPFLSEEEIEYIANALKSVIT